MKKILLLTLVLFGCTSINMYEPKAKRFDFEVFEIKRDVKQLYTDGVLQDCDIENLIKILE